MNRSKNLTPDMNRRDTNSLVIELKDSLLTIQNAHKQNEKIFNKLMNLAPLNEDELETTLQKDMELIDNQLDVLLSHVDSKFPKD